MPASVLTVDESVLKAENIRGETLVRRGEGMDTVMMKRTKLIAAVGISFAMLMGAAEKPAGAITAELAKKCRAMAIKAHPYKMPGEKGAGSAAAERDYFNECIARGGGMPDESAGGGQSGGGQAPAPPPAKQ
jgi:hypothetical protein